MSNYLTTDTDLIAVADAIRVKGGTSSSLSFPDGYVSAIQDIQTGGNLEDITISQDYLVKQNTIVSNGIIFQTDETYPGTPVVLNNTSNVNIPNGDLGENGIGIKIELNRTYHCTGELKIEWSTGEQEIYSIDEDFTPTQYYSNISFPNFSWEGIGISTKTFRYINLTFMSADGYRPYIRLYSNTQITKSGVLLDGSYYQISVTSDGFNTINLNLSDDPRFQAIYKSLAYRSVIASSAPGVSEWCDSLSRISKWQFAGQEFSGSFTFNNVTSALQGAFGVVWNGNGFSTQTSVWFNFPNSAFSVVYQDVFLNNGMIRGISANNVNFISTNAFYSCANLSEVNFPNCVTISNSAFYSCRSLTSITFPNCTSIDTCVFQNCFALTTANFPNCTTIGSSAFYYCSSLSNISFPNCSTINFNAFYSCRKLSDISFPNCTFIGQSAFCSCSELATANFPSCTSIGGYAFQYCSVLTSISFPNCTSIGGYAFQSCYALTTASFPNCTFIGQGAFSSCSALTTASFPNCTIIGNYAFQRCFALTTVSFPNCMSLSQYAFSSCINLSSFYFMGSSIPSIENTTFANTTLSLSSYLGYYGSIYVPASLLASYQTARYWSQYSSRMVGI